MAWASAARQCAGPLLANAVGGGGRPHDVGETLAQAWAGPGASSGISRKELGR